jgi:four helix bundle protein
MSTIQRFEDLEIWQLAREIAKEIYQLTRKDPFRKDYSLVGQIRNSSGSAMDNIAEGFERDNNKEFRYFLSVSKGSAGEARSQLYRALDQSYITRKEFDTEYEKLLELSRKIKSFMSYLSSSGYKGQRFK